MDEPPHAQRDERQHVEAIEPHDITCLADGIATEGIGGRKDQAHRTRPVALAQEDVAGKSRKRHLNQHHEAQKGGALRRVERIHQDIERTREVVCEEREPIASDALRKRMEQRILAAHDPAEPREEAQVLEIHVIDANTEVSKGIDPSQGKGDAECGERNEKSQHVLEASVRERALC